MPAPSASTPISRVTKDSLSFERDAGEHLARRVEAQDRPLERFFAVTRLGEEAAVGLDRDVAELAGAGIGRRPERLAGRREPRQAAGRNALGGDEAAAAEERDVAARLDEERRHFGEAGGRDTFLAEAADQNAVGPVLPDPDRFPARLRDPAGDEQVYACEGDPDRRRAERPPGFQLRLDQAVAGEGVVERPVRVQHRDLDRLAGAALHRHRDAPVGGERDVFRRAAGDRPRSRTR